MMYQANDKYDTVLRNTYLAGDSILDVKAVPANLPTIVVVGFNTEYEAVFSVTGVSGTDPSTYSLTGVTLLRGFNGNIPANTTVKCLNNQEFFNQYSTTFLQEHNSDGTHGDINLSTSTDFTTEHNPDGTHKFDTIAGFSYDSLYRQAIINGNFDVWQRGTSFTFSSAQGYTADRWLANGTIQVDQVVEDVDDIKQAKTLKITAPSGFSGNNLNVQYRMEAQEYAKLVSKYLTLSFWVKGSKTGTFSVVFLAENSSYIAQYGYIAPFTIDSAGVWEKKTITVPPLTTTTGVNLTGSGIGLVIRFAFTLQGTSSSTINTWTSGLDADYSGNTQAVVGDNFQLSQVQLNAGSSALPFMPRSYEEELRKCQRYYYQPPVMSNWYFYALADAQTWKRLGITFPVRMRTTPTISFTATTGGTFNSGHPRVEAKTDSMCSLRGDCTANSWAKLTSFSAEAEL